MFLDAVSPNRSFVKLRVYKGKRLWGKVVSPVIIQSCSLFTLKVSLGCCFVQGNVPGLLETKPGAMVGLKIHKKIKLPQRKRGTGREQG